MLQRALDAWQRLMVRRGLGPALEQAQQQAERDAVLKAERYLDRQFDPVYWQQQAAIWRRVAWVYFLVALLLIAVLTLQYSREVVCRLS